MIRVKEVRVISEEKGQLGVMPVKEALEAAREEGLDLVEVSPQVDPPVCKIMDYGKYLYRKSKKLQEAKKKQKIIQVKSIKVTPKIEEHDYQFKLKHMQKFLLSGDKVKVMMVFKGREVVHSHLGKKVLDRVIADLEDISSIEQEPKIEGKSMIMVLMPKAK
jgi:translation initiation factor IF-3